MDDRQRNRNRSAARQWVRNFLVDARAWEGIDVTELEVEIHLRRIATRAKQRWAINALTAFFDWCVLHGHMEESPMSNVDVPAPMKVNRKASRAETRVKATATVIRQRGDDLGAIRDGT